jgi:hypothetical protein
MVLAFLSPLLGRGSSLALNHVTFAFNTGAIENAFAIAPIRIQNTLLADTWSSQSQIITSLGGNVSVSNNLGLDQPSDLFTNQPAEAFVAPLADNGGATPTHLLTAGSPARDVVSGTCLPTDQRGETRPQGPGCDSGAVEMETITNRGLAHWDAGTPPSRSARHHLLLSILLRTDGVTLSTCGGCSVALA